MTEKENLELSNTTLSSTKTNTLGIMAGYTPEIFRCDYYRQLISGIITGLTPSQFDLKFIFLREGETIEIPEKTLAKHGLDGLLILTWRTHARSLEHYNSANKNLPVIAINDYLPGMKVNFVYVDSTEAARLAVRFLINRGYRRIGMIQAPDDESLDAKERERILRETLLEQGLELDPAHYKRCDYFFEEDGYIKTLEMIHEARTLPRALLCFNDDLAVGVLRALREEKILVPHEVAVIGFDGTERGKYVQPALTTVSQPLERMGQEMARIATGVIRGELSQPVQVRFEPRLVIRQSA